MKRFMIMAVAVAMITACEKPIMYDDGFTVPDASASDKKFTFTLKGDFSNEWKSTRGYLQADGRDLTDVWMLDYMDGTLVQQLHQSDNTADDFGKPTMSLAYGQHHVYFIASRGSAATLDTDAHTISFGKVLDTFYKDYEVTVVSTSNGNRAVMLDRVVTKLRLVFSDAIPANAATFNVTPATWYQGINYTTGEPCAAVNNQSVTINIPSTSIGVTNESVNIYGFSTATEWTTNVTVNSKDAEGNVIGSATIANVPFKANRVSEYTGPLFNSSGSVTLSLNSTWTTAYEGIW